MGGVREGEIVKGVQVMLFSTRDSKPRHSPAASHAACDWHLTPPHPTVHVPVYTRTVKIIKLRVQTRVQGTSWS